MCKKGARFQMGRFNSYGDAIFGGFLIRDAAKRPLRRRNRECTKGIWGKNGRQSGLFLVGGWNATSAVFFGARLDPIEQLVEFLNEHGEPFVVLFLGDEIAEVLHALFRAVI